MAERKGFLVYADLADTLEELSDEEAGVLFKAMMTYFVDGSEPKLPRALRFAFLPVRHQMDRDREKYDRRCERNRENVRKRWEQKEDTNVYDRIRTYTNDTNKKEKEKEKKKEKENKKADRTAEISSSSLEYLNKKTGSCYDQTDTNLELIGSLLSAGYTEADIRTVIDKKCAEWMGDDKMRPYLRPSTLFGEHFEEYLAAPLTGQAAQEQDEAARKERARKAKEEQKRREAALDAKWLEEHKDQLEATRKKWGIPNYEEDAS